MKDSDELWEANRADLMEYAKRRAAFHEAERQRAYEAVNRALSGYRWWGWTNIVNTVRLWIQAWRQR